jgi:hypothetical protein
MTLRSTELGFVALALAIAAVALTAPSARAFTIETLDDGNSSGGSRFADPDDQVKNVSPGTHLFGPNGPAMQFGTGQSPFTRPFNAPSRPSEPPPLPYSNGNNY